MEKVFFNIELLDKADLLSEDASFSLGWFEILEKKEVIPLFKDGYCMVFLTLSDLIRSVYKGEKKFDWVGADNGHKILVERDKNVIRLRDDLIDIKFPAETFINNLRQSTIEFINKCKLYNPSILNESPFKDLENSKDLLKKI